MRHSKSLASFLTAPSSAEDHRARVRARSSLDTLVISKRTRLPSLRPLTPPKLSNHNNFFNRTLTPLSQKIPRRTIQPTQTILQEHKQESSDSSDSIECNSNISLTRETTLNSPNVLSQKPQNTNDIEQKKHSKRSLLRRAFTRSDKKRSRLSNSTTEHGASESSAVSSQGVSRINQENQKPWHKYNFFRRAFTSSDKEPMAVPSTSPIPRTRRPNPTSLDAITIRNNLRISQVINVSVSVSDKPDTADIWQYDGTMGLDAPGHLGNKSLIYSTKPPAISRSTSLKNKVLDHSGLAHRLSEKFATPVLPEGHFPIIHRASALTAVPGDTIVDFPNSRPGYESYADLLSLGGTASIVFPNSVQLGELELPLCLKYAVEVIIRDGLDKEGIFRLCGCAKNVELLHQYWYTKKPLIVFSLSPVENVHDVATFFKKVIMGLPGGLFNCLSLQHRLHLIIVDEVAALSDKVGAVAGVLQSLRLERDPYSPFYSAAERFDLNCAVFGLLALIDSRASENRMTYDHLAICFSPLLMGDIWERIEKRLNLDQGWHIRIEWQSLFCSQRIILWMVKNWSAVVAHL